MTEPSVSMIIASGLKGGGFTSGVHPAAAAATEGLGDDPGAWGPRGSKCGRDGEVGLAAAAADIREVPATASTTAIERNIFLRPMCSPFSTCGLRTSANLRT